MASNGAVASGRGPLSLALAPGRLATVLVALFYRISALVTRYPLLVLVLLRVAEEFRKFWLRRQRLALGRSHVCGGNRGIDGELIQGCLVTLENLETLGRVEKRTLFVQPLLKVLGNNEYLANFLLKSAKECHERSTCCLITRWMPADERYHVLQGCLNALSSLFGANFVHFNAVNASTSGDTSAFKSTWYCLTITTSTRPENRAPELKREKSLTLDKTLETCTFTDMTRLPRATLRIMLVNEAELRLLAAGKLGPPAWGFFNKRHAERYRMMVDFAENFQQQLVQRNLGSGTGSGRRQRVGDAPKLPPSSGMKRVQSQPVALGTSPRRSMSQLSSTSSSTNSQSLQPAPAEMKSAQGEATRDGGSDESCFLRLHVPHYLGHQHGRPFSLAQMAALSGKDSPTNQQPAAGSLGTSSIPASKGLARTGSSQTFASSSSQWESPLSGHVQPSTQFQLERRHERVGS